MCWGVFFTERVVKHWYRLSSTLAESSSMEMLKKCSGECSSSNIDKY